MMDPQAASLEMTEKFWSDWFASMGTMQAQAMQSMGNATPPWEAAQVEDSGPGPAAAAGFGASPFGAMTPEMLRQFQNAFLQSLSGYCERYMRTPEFLDGMKRAMDNALTFRQQVNEFLDGAVSAGFRPPGGMPADQTVIVDAVRETERKLRDHIDVLTERLEKIETHLNAEKKP